MEPETRRAYKKGLRTGFIRGMNVGLIILLTLWFLHLL